MSRSTNCWRRWLIMSSNLALYLEGPLQSWGHMADHASRNTLSHPTRSGLTGSLVAAMGIDRDSENESEHVARLGRLRMTVLGVQFAPPDGKRRRPRNGGQRTRDFHTAQRRNARGQVVGNAEVTRRDYLHDCRFVVFLEGDPGLLVEVESALRNPRWFCTLGRRSCVPTSPIVLGRFASEREALSELGRRLGREMTVTLQVEEASPGDPGVMLIQDLPLTFKARLRGQRAVKIS